jgi:hypothetical protein
MSSLLLEHDAVRHVGAFTLRLAKVGRDIFDYLLPECGSDCTAEVRFCASCESQVMKMSLLLLGAFLFIPSR